METKTKTAGALDRSDKRPEAERTREVETIITITIRVQGPRKAVEAIRDAARAIFEAESALRHLPKTNGQRASSLGWTRRKTSTRRKAVDAGLPKMSRKHSRSPSTGRSSRTDGSKRRVERPYQSDQSQPWEVRQQGG